MENMNFVECLKWSLREVTTSNRMIEAYTLIGMAAGLAALLGKSFWPLAVGAGLAAIWTVAWTLWFGLSKDGRQAFEEARAATRVTRASL